MVVQGDVTVTPFLYSVLGVQENFQELPRSSRLVRCSCALATWCSQSRRSAATWRLHRWKGWPAFSEPPPCPSPPPSLLPTYLLTSFWRISVWKRAGSFWPLFIEFCVFSNLKAQSKERRTSTYCTRLHQPKEDTLEGGENLFLLTLVSIHDR